MSTDATSQAVTDGQAKMFLGGAGLVIDELTGSRVTGHIELGSEHHTPWGIVHGGVYCTVIEGTASIGASAAVRDRGKFAVGLTNTTHFLRPLTSGTVTVDAVALNQGRTQQLWRVRNTVHTRPLIYPRERPRPTAAAPSPSRRTPPPAHRHSPAPR